MDGFKPLPKLTRSASKVVHSTPCIVPQQPYTSCHFSSLVLADALALVTLSTGLDLCGLVGQGPPRRGQARASGCTRGVQASAPVQVCTRTPHVLVPALCTGNVSRIHRHVNGACRVTCRRLK